MASKGSAQQRAAAVPEKVLSAVTGRAMHSVVLPIVSYWWFPSFLVVFFVCYSNVSEQEGKHDPPS